MSHVASLELCDQLFELSGWPYDIHDDESGYSLGYLLRKLPPCQVGRRNHGRNSKGLWSITASYVEYPNASKGRRGRTFDLNLGADTPEDAAAKLAIELFNQGVLTR